MGETGTPLFPVICQMIRMHRVTPPDANFTLWGYSSAHNDRLICSRAEELISIVCNFFPVPVCAITASGVPGDTFVSMNRFSTLCG
jgi:hypothetical protein